MPAANDTVFQQLDTFLRVRWGVILLTGALSLIAVVVGGVFWETLWPALTVLGFAIAYSALVQGVVHRWLRQRPAGLVLVKWFVPLIDIIAIVVLCHFSGGIASPYSLLLLLNVAIAALALGSRHAYLGAVWSTVLYGAMIVLEATGILPAVWPTASTMPPWAILYANYPTTAAAFLLIAGLFLVGAAVGSHVSRQLQQQQAEITRLYQATQRESAKMRLVNELSRSLTAILEWPTLLARILSELHKAVPSDYAGLYLYDDKSGTLRLVATRGFSDQEAREAEATAMERHPGWVVANRRTLLVADTTQDPRVHYPSARRSASVLMVPLLYQERCLGVLAFGSKEKGAFGQEEQELLEGLSPPLAVAIANARLYEESRATLESLRQTQEKLVRSVRLAAVGDLLAGLAHELNNPLGIIVGNAQLALETAGLDPETRTSLEAISAAGQRIAHLVRVLVDLERLREERFHEVDLGKVVDEALGLVRAQVEEHHVTVEKEIQRPLPPVWGSQARLMQVTHGLLMNALEAMAGQERPKFLSLKVLADGGEVVLTVRDTGRGLSPEGLAHAFEPGYSTKVEKGRARGLGLGLFVAYHTVRAHGGDLSLVSQEGSGTMVTVRLPAFSPSVERENPTDTVPIRA